MVLALLLVTGSRRGELRGHAGPGRLPPRRRGGLAAEAVGPGDRGVDGDRADDLGRRHRAASGTDVHGAEHQAAPGDLPSTPSWAPDGSKFAFAKRIADNGDYEGLEHSAIFVHTLATGETRQVTHPEDARAGHGPRGAARVRARRQRLRAGVQPRRHDDRVRPARPGPSARTTTLWDKRGQNLWRVAAERRRPGPDHDAARQETASADLERRLDPRHPGSRRLLLHAGTRAGARAGQQRRREPDVPRRQPNEAITDYDVSPDGTKLAFDVLGAGGVTPFVQPLSGAGRRRRGLRRQWLRRDRALRRQRRRAAAFGLHRAHPVRLRPAEPAHARPRRRHRRAASPTASRWPSTRRCRATAARPARIGARHPAAGAAGDLPARASSARGSRAARRRSGRASRSRT